MKKRLLVIEAASAGCETAFQELAESDRFFVIYVTRSPTPSHIRNLVDDVIEAETNRPADLVETVRSYIQATAPVDGAITLLELYVMATEYVRAAFGLPGNGISSAGACRNKLLMRERLAQRSVAIPKFRCVRDLRELSAGVQDVGGLPCVIKPIDGTGSLNVILARSLDDASQAYHRILATTRNSRGQDNSSSVLIEQFVTGPEFSVDALSARGLHVVIGINQYTTAPLPYLTETGFFTPPDLDSSAIEEAITLAYRGMDALGVEMGPAHCELKLGPDGPVVIEIASRFGGAHIPELLRQTTGIDYYVEGSLIACGSVALPAVNQRCAGAVRHLYPTDQGVLVSSIGLEALLNRPGFVAVYVDGVGNHVQPGVRDYTSSVGHVIFTAPESAQATERAEQAADSISFITRQVLG